MKIINENLYRMDLVDDYIWGKVDETEYLQNIVANDSIHAESLLSKIETIQRSLNTQLRQGVVLVFFC